MHRLFWTLFGITAGGIYTLLFQHFWPGSPRLTLALGAAVMLLFAFGF